MKLLLFALTSFAFTSAKAQSCPSGEVLDVNGICIQPKFIQGCSLYASTLACSQCEYNYKLNQDIGLCQYVKNSPEPCCLQKLQNKCTKCNVGLLLTPEGSCRQNTIIGCLQKSSAGGCTNCASDFVLAANGTCVPGVKDCQSYLNGSSNQVCVKCKVNFSLVNNACLKNKILGCQYQVKHRCLKCLEPFRPSEDHCEIPKCLTYNDFGCTGCECGYYLNPKNLCEQVKPGCIRYQRGICTDCQSHFKLRGGSCVMEGCEQVDFLTCKKCSDGYTLVQGGCKLNNCYQWDNGVCFACDRGFVTVQGRCRPQKKPAVTQN